MFPDKANNKLLKREKNNILRELKSYNKGIDLFSNDYLGLGKAATISKYNGEGSGGSRLISGNKQEHILVEKFLAEFYESESALLFNSGYTANLGLIGSVPQKGDTILYDALCHASIREGIRLSFANAYSFKHNDTNDLIKKASKATGDVFVITEGLFSMDGDFCPLAELSEICFKNDWFLILDEAHSTGISGQNHKGLFEETTYPIFARVHTFGKALGYHGAVVCGSKKLIDYLINFSKPFIYTTAIPAEQCEIIVEKHRLIQQSKSAQNKLQSNILAFNSIKEKLGMQDLFLNSKSPIQGFLHSKEVLTEVEDELLKNGFLVKAIFSPTVAEGKERIRIILHSYNSNKEIEQLLYIIKKYV